MAIKLSVSSQRHGVTLTHCDRKTVRFFPHEIADLSIALGFLRLPPPPRPPPSALVSDAGQWALRYVVLIWLSLIIMIPFDLAQFDEDDRAGETATAIEAVGKEYLGRAGLEREGCAILLSRLYMRCEVTLV